MDECRLPVLRGIVHKHPLPATETKNVHLIVVQHLLEDTAYFLECVNEAPFASISVVGIEYSSVPSVSDSIRQRTASEVVVPPYRLLPETLRSLAVRLLERCRSRGDRLLVHEIGGVCGPILVGKLSLNQRYCLGVVEDTTAGLRVYRGLEERLQFPVYHVASSDLKRLEAIYVGEAVATELQSALSLLGLRLAGRKCGVIGFGPIGQSVAEALRRRLATVSVFDVNPLKTVAAAMHGFAVHPRDVVLGQSELIVGATGHPSVTAEDIGLLSTGTILCSASSGNIEFPTEQIRSSARRGSVDKKITRFDLSSGQS